MSRAGLNTYSIVPNVVLTTCRTHVILLAGTIGTVFFVCMFVMETLGTRASVLSFPKDPTTPFAGRPSLIGARAH